jgi:hypothetical protein
LPAPPESRLSGRAVVRWPALELDQEHRERAALGKEQLGEKKEREHGVFGHMNQLGHRLRGLRKVTGMDWNVVFAGISALASLGTLIYAGVAVNTWRDQLAGASSHDLAKRVGLGLLKCTTHRRRLLSALSDHTNAAGAHTARLVESGAEELIVAATELAALADEAELLWDPAATIMVMHVANESRALARYADALVDTTDEGPIRRRVYANPRTAPSFTGRVFGTRLDKYSFALQMWLGSHLGRKRGMTNDALWKMRSAIDEDFKRLALEEQAGLALEEPAGPALEEAEQVASGHDQPTQSEQRQLQPAKPEPEREP